MKHKYLYVGREDLRIEKQQLVDEGKDISSLEGDFERIGEADLENDLSAQSDAEALLDKCRLLPAREGYPYLEPSCIEGIMSGWPEARPEREKPGKSYKDRLLGAWLGRACGCLLGKPVEGWSRKKIRGYLEDAGRYPLKGYFPADAPAGVLEKYGINRDRFSTGTAGYMPEDDDMNYTVAALAVIENHGKDFTSDDVAGFWLSGFPILKMHTAERAAYRNLVLQIPPPESAFLRNPYREWIGAQIRGDFYGYVSPGMPGEAAGLAYKDARISHAANGIYGCVWVAAMLAAASASEDAETAIKTALEYVPAGSRFHEAVSSVLGWFAGGISHADCVERIHAGWDENDKHHWCHTLSNAQIVACALLWGGGDFGRTVCMAVQPGFDTDCNGATAGSVAGMILGAGNLPGEWIRPLNDTIQTGVDGYGMVKISALAERSYELCARPAEG